MPIKRAGPFASSTNSFLDEPETPDESVVPVNCNKHQSATWPWRAFVFLQGEGILEGLYKSGPVSETVENDLDTGIGIITVKFAYQATESWSFSGSQYSTDTAQGSLTDVITVSIDGDEVFSDEGQILNGSLDEVVFPSASVPKIVEISLIGDAVNGAIVLTLPLA